METQTYAAATVQTIRSCLHRALRPPDNLDNLSETSRVKEIEAREEEFFPSRNFVVQIELGRLSKCLRGLRVKPGVAVIGKMFRDDHGGGGQLWAVRDRHRSGALEWLLAGKHVHSREMYSALGLGLEFLPPIHALEGEPSFRSYLEASLLAREFKEFGAWWHSVSWGTHDLVDFDPRRQTARRSEQRSESTGTARTARGVQPMDDPSRWTFRRVDQPKDWRPTVQLLGAGGAVVQFITMTAHQEERLVLHRDTYSPGSWEPNVSTRTLATGHGGYIF